MKKGHGAILLTLSADDATLLLLALEKVAKGKEPSASDKGIAKKASEKLLKQLERIN